MCASRSTACQLSKLQHGISSDIDSPVDTVPDQRLIVKVPDGDVPVRAAGEAHLGVWADGQSVAGWGRRRQLSLDPWGGCGQVPYGEGASLAPNDQGPSVRKQATGTNVVVSVLMGHMHKGA